MRTVPVHGYVRGHPVVWDGEEWRWEDTGARLSEVNGRACVHCHERPTEEGYDACLGNIPGATGACCGHGVHIGYVTWPGVGVQQDEYWHGVYLREGGR